jgi:hypothetical protein
MAGGVAHKINNPIAKIMGKASFTRRMLEAKKAKVDAFIASDACKYKSKPHRAIVESVINGWIDWNAQ